MTGCVWHIIRGQLSGPTRIALLATAASNLLTAHVRPTASIGRSVIVRRLAWGE